MFRKFGSLHAWHHDIGQHHINRRIEQLNEFERFLTIGGHQYVVPGIRQRSVREYTDQLLVLDDQDLLSPPSRGTRSGRLPCLINLPPSIREPDNKRGSNTDLAFNLNASIGTVHHAVNRRESETCTLTYGLSGKEGLKDAFTHLFVHANATVSHGEQNTIACEVGGPTHSLGGRRPRLDDDWSP